MTERTKVDRAVQRN